MIYCLLFWAILKNGKLLPISRLFGPLGPNLSSGCRRLNLTQQKQSLLYRKSPFLNHPHRGKAQIVNKLKISVGCVFLTSALTSTQGRNFLRHGRVGQFRVRMFVIRELLDPAPERLRRSLVLEP